MGLPGSTASVSVSMKQMIHMMPTVNKTFKKVYFQTLFHRLIFKTYRKQVEDADPPKMPPSLRFVGGNCSVKVGQVLREESHHGNNAKILCLR